MPLDSNVLNTPAEFAILDKPVVSKINTLDKQKAQYFKELIKYLLEEEKKGNKIAKNKMSAIKGKLCRKFKLMAPPKDTEVLMSASKEDLETLKFLKSKPTRSLSGVAVVAVMTRPEKCPHGKCTFCPGGVCSNFGDTPQSYTGFEPATRRAIRNDYDAFLQVFNRLEQYILSGHNPNKVDLIIMGGTFPSYNLDYQYEFVINLFLAMNVFSKLFYYKAKNETILASGKDDSELDYAKYKTWFLLPHTTDNKEIEVKLKKKIYQLKEKSLKSIKYSSNLSIAEKEKILEKLKKQNEFAAIRCIGLTQETRPDYAKLEHAKQMLLEGTTRVELGVQSVYNEILDISGRGHTVEDSIKATAILKDLGFKINYHVMLGLPGSNKKKDLECLNTLFSDPNFKPDMLKIYPCLLIKGTKLYEDFKLGKYQPISLEDSAEIIGKFLDKVPTYVRVMRIQRDIPSTLVEGGVHRTNLRQYVDQFMLKNKLVSKEIRAREILRHNQIKDSKNIEIKTIEYDASGGKEFFISAEDFENKILIGFCRLRFVSNNLDKLGIAKMVPEIKGNSAIIRELHVYGSALNLGGEASYSETGQHKGWGKKLVLEAEKIAKQNKKTKLLVISGVGVKEYYRKLGYVDDGCYVSKSL